MGVDWHLSEEDKAAAEALEHPPEVAEAEPTTWHLTEEDEVAGEQQQEAVKEAAHHVAEDKTKSDLQKQARAAHVSDKGTKDEIAARLLDKP